ncbi:MAG: 2,3-bisphosphoglycerate-independent phosphoglycerate mutase, partial [candidate division WS6 bacterium GW2011_GWA2_37_6]
MAEFYSAPKPIVLIVMDGVGVAPPGPGNAVTLADTPNLDKLWPKYPHGSLEAAGMAVGLPEGVDGNSEVGHMAIGTGRVIFQDLPRIDQKIVSGEFSRNTEIIKAIDFAKKNNGRIHITGLVGFGKVHSSFSHLEKLIELIAQQNIGPDKLFVHAILDGRDSSPTAGLQVLTDLENELDRKRIGRIASFIGRYFAMDRDQRWDRTKIAYDMIVKAQGEKTNDFRRTLQKSYQKGLTDEYMTAHIIPGFNGELATVKSGDTIINFNFRPDRALQITRAFEEESFQGFEREKIESIYYLGFSDYKKGFPSHIAFPQDRVLDSLGKVLSENRLTQLRIAESEKFPHVTYFFDGGQQVIYPGEDAIEVPSPKNVSTYDQTPEMSSKKIVEVFLKKMEEKKYDFALINFAPPDMVAHTGVLDAAIKAVEAVDWAIGEVTKYVISKKGLIILTSDHGNCEELINLRTGEVDTKHSSN